MPDVMAYQCQISNGKKEVKKGNASKFYPPNVEQIKSNSEGVVALGLYSSPKKWFNRAKTGVHGTQTKIPRPGESGSRPNWPRSIEKSNLSYQIWSHKGSTF